MHSALGRRAPEPTWESSEFYAGEWDESAGWYTSASRVFLQAGNAAGASPWPTSILRRSGSIRVGSTRQMRSCAMPVAYCVPREASSMPSTQACCKRACYWGWGDFGAAESTAKTAAAAFASLGNPVSAFEAGLVQAEATMGLGDPRRAILIVDEAQEGTRGEGGWLQPRAELVRANALFEMNLLNEARQAVAGGLSGAREHHLPYEEALLLRTSSRLNLRTETPGAAVSAEAEAAAADRILEALGVSRSAAKGTHPTRCEAIYLYQAASPRTYTCSITRSPLALVLTTWTD